MLKIATWNVNSLRVRLPHVLQWLEHEQPDILALQETKTTDENFPIDAIIEHGYQVTFSGQKTYNGVAIISRSAAANLITDFPSFPDPQRRLLCATYGNICVLNVYVPNGSAVGSEKYTYKLEWLSQLRAFAGTLMEKWDKLILLGDFNIAPADEDVHDPDEWRDQVLCSEPERKALIELLDKGFSDCFRLFKQEQNSFSWWDYRAAAFRRNRGLRIDLILSSGALTPLCRTCRIDKTPRALEKPSDHAPVVAEFAI